MASDALTYESLRSMAAQVYESAHIPVTRSKQVHECSGWELVQLGLQRIVDNAGLYWPWQWHSAECRSVWMVDTRHVGIIGAPSAIRSLYDA